MCALPPARLTLDCHAGNDLIFEELELPGLAKKMSFVGGYAVEQDDQFCTVVDGEDLSVIRRERIQPDSRKRRVRRASSKAFFAGARWIPALL